MIVPTLLIGFLFHRTITEPMRELVERTNLVGKGDRNALRPLKRHGTSEFARLSQSFLEMARRLNTRSSFISTFATHVSHELKSPLTSIQGAAELLRDDIDATTPTMTDKDRRKFLDNIIADADRLTQISGRLRDLARAENPVAVGAAKLSASITGLRSAFPSLDIRASGDLDTPMRVSEENATIIFSNLADNAMRHGSSTLDISAAQQGNSLLVKVNDDGEGVSPNNRTQIFDSFFTTRRDSGGTGMGLAIVRAMLDAHGGAARLVDCEQGTAFELTIPVADGRCRAERNVRSADANARRRDDQARLPMPVDHRLRSRLAQVRARSRAAVRAREVWRVDAVGNDGVLSGGNCRSRSAALAHGADLGFACGLRRAVSAGTYPVAGRFPADDSGRAAARPRVLAMEYARLWRRHYAGDDPRPPGKVGLHKNKAFSTAHPSLRQLKPLETVQHLLDAAF